MFSRVPDENKLSRFTSDSRLVLAPSPEALRTAQWSPPLQTLLDQPSSTLPLKLALGGMIFSLCFSSWAWLGRINEVAHAQGKLIPKGAVYRIDPVDMGKVSRVLVKEGQFVQAGQPIVELDPELEANEVDRLEKELAANQTQLTQMQTLMTQLIMQAQTRSAIARAATDGQKAAAIQAQGSIGNNQAIIDQLKADSAAQETRLDRLQSLVKEGAISQEQVFQAEQSLRERQRSITERQGALDQTQAEADKMQSELVQKQAEEQQFQLEAQQQIQQLRMQITQLQAKADQTQTLLQSAQAKRRERIVSAPVSGEVSTLLIRNPGEVVQPGQPVAEIAPRHQPLVLSAVLPSREAGFVKVGMPVQLKFDAFPYQNYGIVAGKVMTISPDAQADQQLGQVYRVEVQLDQDHVTNEHQRVLFKAGQTASAEIVTRQRRIVDILLDPLKQLQGDVNL
jgi:hemolysin D